MSAARGVGVVLASLVLAGCDSYIRAITVNFRNVDDVVLENVRAIVGRDVYRLGNVKPGEARVLRVNVGKESPIDIEHGKDGPAQKRTRFRATTYSEADGEAFITIDYARDRAVKVTKTDFSKEPWREWTPPPATASPRAPRPPLR